MHERAERCYEREKVLAVKVTMPCVARHDGDYLRAKLANQRPPLETLRTYRATPMERMALLLHPALGGRLPSQTSTWTTELDEVLALAVRRHLFDFAATSNELRLRHPALRHCDAAACRQRWAELDLLACASFADAADSADAPDDAPPSDFNIFHNNLHSKMKQIFCGIRSELPTMADDDDDEVEDEEDEDDDEDEEDGDEEGDEGEPPSAVPLMVVEDVDSEPAAAYSKAPEVRRAPR